MAQTDPTIDVANRIDFRPGAWRVSDQPAANVIAIYVRSNNRALLCWRDAFSRTRAQVLCPAQGSRVVLEAARFIRAPSSSCLWIGIRKEIWIAFSKLF
jgi:hypothetical protein